MYFPTPLIGIEPNPKVTKAFKLKEKALSQTMKALDDNAINGFRYPASFFSVSNL